MDRTSTRFLLNIAYNGTRFFGIQRQTAITTDLIPSNFDNTIQMAIELALCTLKYPSVPWPSTGLLSRTDAGVHANQNYVMVGLNHPQHPKVDYEEDEITDTVNRYMRDMRHEIIAKSTHRVSRNYFVLRPAIFREYKYYFYLTQKGQVMRNIPPSSDLDKFAAIELFASQKFSLSEMKKALIMMKGMHNFKSFEAIGAQLGLLGAERRDAIREVTICDVEPVHLTGNSFSDDLYRNLPIYAVTIRSSGFLYKQVRRMVGIALMAALGDMKLSTLQGMLDYPHHWQWSNDYMTAPPQGLFLNRLCFRGLEEIE